MNKYKKVLPDEPSFIQNGLKGYLYNINKENLEISFVDSFKGHDKYVYNKESTHIYYIIEGSGEFCINKEIVTVQKGDLIEIPENIEFVYAGNMKLLLIMNPGFKPENNIEVKDNDLYKNR